MAAFIINAAKVIGFLVVSLSAILSFYSAINAVSVHSNYDVFFSGVFTVGVGVILGPLFCYIAGYGFVRYLDQPVWEAVMIILPTALAWCVVAGRLLIAAAR